MKALQLNCVILPSKFYKPPWSFSSYRCPQYEGGSQCLMVPDPQDPECCKVPQCPQGNTVPPVIIGTQSPTPAQTTPFKIVINPNGPIIFGTPEPSTPVPRRWSTNWGGKNHMLFHLSSKFNNDQIRNMNWSLWSENVPFVWYNCSLNQLYWGGVAVKKLNAELCFVKESTIIHSEIILCLF